jgi:predicted nucleic acid-binding protein
MSYLVDTGVLLRLFDDSDPEHTVISECLRLLRKDGQELFTSCQNLAEFWNTTTRPETARGGYGKSVELTDRRVQFIFRMGSILPDTPVACQEWHRLVVAHQVQGVAVHDARIVALMNVSKVKSIITLNPRDFSRYPGLTVLTPTDVLKSFTS